MILQEPPPKLNLRRLEQIQQWLRYVAVIVLLVFVVLIVFSWIQLRGIRGEIKDAEANLNATQGRLAEEQANYNRVVNRSQQKLKELESLKERAAELSTAIAFCEDPKKAQEVAEATGVKSQTPPRIYLHIRHEDQRGRAGEVARELQAKGYVVPGIETVPGKSYITSEARLLYYKRSSQADMDDISRQDVNDISAIIRGLGITLDVPSQPFVNDRVKPRVYEVWFSNDFQASSQ